MTETVVIEGQQGTATTKQKGVIDADSMQGVTSWFALVNGGFYDTLGTTTTTARVDPEANRSYLEGNVAGCWGTGPPCVQSPRTFNAAPSMHGLPKFGMLLTLILVRILWFAAMIVGGVVGTLLTFRLVRPELILEAEGPGFSWKIIGTGHQAASTPN